MINDFAIITTIHFFQDIVYLLSLKMRTFMFPLNNVKNTGNFIRPAIKLNDKNDTDKMVNRLGLTGLAATFTKELSSKV